MTLLVRVAVASGQEGSGVAVKYGSQVAEIPVGGVQTFALYDGKQVALTIREADAPEQTGDSPSDVSEQEVLQASVTALEAEVEHLKSQLAAVSNAVKDA